EQAGLWPWSWLWCVICHAIRRWALLIPLVGFWIYVFLGVLMDDVPLPNLTRSGFIYLWFVGMRQSCARPRHLVPSLFFMHQAAYLRNSPCHNTAIFESCWLVEVAVFALFAALRTRPARVPRAAALLWLLALVGVARHKQEVATRRGVSSFPEEERAAAYRVNGHSILALLPYGLATVAMLGLLPSKAALVPPLCGSSRRRLLVLVGLLGIVASITAAGLWSSGPAKQWRERLELPVEFNLDYVADQLIPLPLVFGVLLLFKVCEAADNNNKADAPSSSGSPQRSVGWSLLSLLGRLAPGMNLANLFVLQLHRGFDAGGYGSDSFQRRALEASWSHVLGLLLSLLVTSAAVSLAVFLVVEAPCTALIREPVARETARRQQEQQ
ncbi:unnamed protein product, partial [Polarella glacialis]